RLHLFPGVLLRAPSDHASFAHQASQARFFQIAGGDGSERTQFPPDRGCAEARAGAHVAALALLELGHVRLEWPYSFDTPRAGTVGNRGVSKVGCDNCAVRDCNGLSASARRLLYHPWTLLRVGRSASRPITTPFRIIP